MTCASAWMESALLDPDGGQRWVIYDEARRLMAHPGLLHRVDAQSRLARHYGIVNMLIFHKLTDLDNVGASGTAARALTPSLLANAETAKVSKLRFSTSAWRTSLLAEPTSSRRPIMLMSTKPLMSGFIASQSRFFSTRGLPRLVRPEDRIPLGSGCSSPTHVLSAYRSTGRLAMASQRPLTASIWHANSWTPALDTEGAIASESKGAVGRCRLVVFTTSAVVSRSGYQGDPWWVKGAHQ